jgi:hypothetical protein
MTPSIVVAAICRLVGISLSGWHASLEGLQISDTGADGRRWVTGHHHPLIADTAEVPQFAAALLRRSGRQWRGHLMP